MSSRRRRRYSSVLPGEGVSSPSSRRLPREVSSASFSSFGPSEDLEAFDLPSWRPSPPMAEAFNALRRIFGVPPVVTARPPLRKLVVGLPSMIWEDKRAKVCVSRARRREVLFSKGVAGSKGITRRRTTVNSKLSCK